MGKPIVVGISGSAGSQAALVWALQRAARDELRSWSSTRWTTAGCPLTSEYHELIRESGMELLQKARGSARVSAPDVEGGHPATSRQRGSVLRETPRRQRWWLSAGMTSIGWTAGR